MFKSAPNTGNDDFVLSCQSHPGWHILLSMTTRTNQTSCPFTPKEREYIRRELDIFFGTLPSVAEGFQLRTWRSGPHARQPKIPPPLQTMVDRGLMEVRMGAHVPKAFFTKSGLVALRLIASDGATWTRRNSLTSEQNSACRPKLT